MPHDFAFVAFGGRARGVHAIQARSSGREASADPPVTRLPNAAGQQLVHGHAAVRRPRTSRSASPTAHAGEPLRHQQSYHHHRQSYQQLHDSYYPSETLRRPRSGVSGQSLQMTIPSSSVSGSTGRASDHVTGILDGASSLSPASLGTSGSLRTSRASPRLASSATTSSSSSFATMHSFSLDQTSRAGAELVEAWLAAAGRADIFEMVQMARAGFGNVGASHPETKISALHLAASLAREDCVCAIFELARSVGARHASYSTANHDSYERIVCTQTDLEGRNALHHAATASDLDVSTEQMNRTVRRLVSYGISPFACDYHHKTPLMLARDLGNSKATSALAGVSSAAGA